MKIGYVRVSKQEQHEDCKLPNSLRKMISILQNCNMDLKDTRLSDK